MRRNHWTSLIAIVVSFVAGCTTVVATPPDLDAVIELTESPSNYRLYPRDKENRGWVVVAGTVKPDDVREIQVRAWRDGQPWHDAAQPVNASQFSLRIPIEAGLYLYTVETSVVLAGGETRLLLRAENIVAGDVYLIQGQSNAVAADYHKEHLANQSQSTWIRSYGTASTNPDDVRKDRRWHLADGEKANDSGTVGAWGLRMAQVTVDTYGIPIALLNGAVGGTPINYHLRDDDNPLNLSTNYGRLLARSRAARIAGKVKAILWYQGESDGNTTTRDYSERFRDLVSDWNEDYPGVKHIYVCQVRAGCGNPTISLRDLMRRFGDFFPKVEVMSTTAAPRHDLCHFFYDGYRELGDRLARLIARDFHGSGGGSDITPPNPVSATWTSEKRDEILIQLRKPEDKLVVDRGAYEDFKLLGGSPSDRVTGVESAGPGELLVHLAGPSTAKGIAYDGHAGDGPWVANGRGVGLLVFRLSIE